MGNGSNNEHSSNSNEHISSSSGGGSSSRGAQLPMSPNAAAAAAASAAFEAAERPRPGGSGDGEPPLTASHLGALTPDEAAECVWARLRTFVRVTSSSSSHSSVPSSWTSTSADVPAISAFAAFDYDRSGCLSARQFRQALESTGLVEAGGRLVFKIRAAVVVVVIVWCSARNPSILFNPKQQEWERREVERQQQPPQ
mmetsp:Transcript_38659/g.76199  ORF Transcript_38659/g.76199 Transcript_38659/m.76199 type:complete len:198 (+) Transcript_38659:2028-2621(+)